MMNLEKRLQAIVAKTIDADPLFAPKTMKVAKAVWNAARLYERKRWNGKILHAQLNQGLAQKRGRRKAKR